MGAIQDAFNYAFRDYSLDGIPSSGAHEPVKLDIRDIGTEIEQFISGVALGDIYETTAAGIAATDNGDLFLVKGNGTTNFADLYKNVAGTAVYQGVSLPSTQYVTETRAMIGNATVSSGNLLSSTSANFVELNGASAIVIGGRRVGMTIPAGATGVGSYVIPRIPFKFSEAADLAGDMIYIVSTMDATANYLAETPFGGNAVRVDFQDGTTNNNAGALVSAVQNGNVITRIHSYTMVGNEAFVGPTHQIGTNTATGATRSFEVKAVAFTVHTPAALVGESGDDKTVDYRLMALESAFNVYPHIVDAFQLANGAEAILDAEGRAMGVALTTGETGEDSILQWRYILTGRERDMIRGNQIRVTMGFDTSANWARTHTVNMQVRNIDLTVSNIVTSNIVDAAVSATRRVISFTFLCPDSAELESIQPFINYSGAVAATGAETIKMTEMSFEFYRVVSDIDTTTKATQALADERGRSAAVEQAQATVDETGEANAAHLAVSGYASVAATLAAATRTTSPGARAVAVLENATYNENSLGKIAGGGDGDNVVMRGVGKRRSLINGRLAASTAQATIIATSPLDFNGQQVIEAVTAYGRNCRYAFHIDSVKFKPNISLLVKDCEFIHEGNDDADAFWGGPVWISQHGVGMGTASGARYTFQNVLAKGPRAGFSAHNQTDFKDPSVITITDSQLVATQVGGAALRLESLGSGVKDRMILTGNTLSGDIIHDPSPWLLTDPAKIPANKLEFELVGHGNSPAVWRNQEWGRALRIVSATTGANSKVVISGAAAAVLFGTVTQIDGDVGMPGSSVGSQDIQETTIASRPGAITKLGSLLGNRTGSPIVLTVTVDGGSAINVTFNTDYSAMTNAQVLTDINTALGSAAVASEYNVGLEERPVFSDEEGVLQNTSATTILTGMALVHDTNGSRTVRPMTFTDAFADFVGIAWEVIRPGAFGRVKTGGWIDRSDVLRSDGGAIDLNERFTIDPAKPGYVVSGSNDGIGILRCVRTVSGQDLVTLAVEAGEDNQADARIDEMAFNYSDEYVVEQADTNYKVFDFNELQQPTFYYDYVRGGYNLRYLDFEDDIERRASYMYDIYIAEADDPNIIPLDINEYGEVVRWMTRVPFAEYPKETSGGDSTIAYGLWEEGQSNSEAESGTSTSLVRTQYKPSGKIMMLASSAMNVWLGKVTSAGASVPLLQSEITGISDLVGALGNSTHGTTAGEGYVFALSKYLQAKYMGYAPEFLLVNNAEGGQTIANLMAGAPAGYYAYSNFVNEITRAYDLYAAQEKRFLLDRIQMSQGESNATLATLGAEHEAFRAERETAAVIITGQAEHVHLLDLQMSSFMAGQFAGVLDILREHVAQLGPNALLHLVGPTYNFRYGSDFLHHTSVEHERRGQLVAAMDMVLRNGGQWDVLRPLSRTNSGANQITITMSEAIVIDAAGEVDAIADSGVTLVGSTVSGVSVSGSNLIIDTVGLATDVTAVRIAMSGHVTTRTQATVPRSNIRSAASYGKYSDGRDIRKWAVHATIS